MQEETSKKSLKVQLDSSTESDRSSSHVNSVKTVSFSPGNMEVSLYSESTEAGVQKTLSARREGDWTCPTCDTRVFATRSECYRCLNKPMSEFKVQIHTMTTKRSFQKYKKN